MLPKGRRPKNAYLVFEESVLFFNSDSLFKIASYLSAEGLFNLALTCRRFVVRPTSSSGGDSLSLVEETARRIVHDVATEEEMAALPRYDEDNWLSKYEYLLSLRIPLAFDQLLGSRLDMWRGTNHVFSIGKGVGLLI